MNPLATLFVVVIGAALLIVPRSWAPLPLLTGACYMTLAQGLEIGPFSFTVIRILIGIGLLRVLLRGERLEGGLQKADWILLGWGVWTLISSAFHLPPKDALIFRLGLVYNVWGVYLLVRVFCRSTEDVLRLAKALVIILIPVACEMALEHGLRRNLFAFLGGVPESPVVRNGRLRAQGPFAHAILAGTVGAVSLPWFLGLWHYHRQLAVGGAVVCLTMVVASSSSGPQLALLAGVFGLICWRWRHWTRQLRIAAVAGYILLDLVMKAPAYYLIARIDLAGGSTGWHRAHLIEMSIKHLNEWWFAGTDYTRHWMPTGVSWSPEHTDITNYYIQMGVWGGLPLLALFLWFLWQGFKTVGSVRRITEPCDPSQAFFIWAIGASLLAHAATATSVSYFDQSFLFLYTAVAAMVSVHAAVTAKVAVPAAELAPDQLALFRAPDLQPVVGPESPWVAGGFTDTPGPGAGP